MSKPLRLIQLANTLAVSDGGPARNSFELNIALNQIPDVSARIYWMKGETGSSVLATHTGRLPERAPMRLRGLKVVHHFLKELRDTDALIIHGYFLWWIPAATALATVFRVPVLLTPHGSLTAHQRTHSVLKKRTFNVLGGWITSAFVDQFVVGSDREGSDLQDALPRARVVTCGVGTPIPTNEQSDRPWGKPIRLLTLGRIAPKKRIELSIRSVSVLRERGVFAELTIAGDGEPELTRALRKLAVDDGSSDCVHFAGLVVGPRKSSLIADSDVFLLPSDDENFGIAVAEALAGGLPVVVSTEVAAADGLPTAAGVRVSKPTAETIADGVMAVVEGVPEERRRAAYDFARGRFSWHEVATRWAAAARSAGRGARASEVRS